MTRVIAVLCAFYAASACSSSSTGTAAPPACAKPYLGSWNINDSGKQVRKPSKACDALKPSYAASGSLNATGDKWTETDANDGSQMTYGVRFQQLGDQCILYLDAQQTTNGVTVAASRVLSPTKDDASVLTGFTDVGVTGGGVDCEVVYNTKGTAQ